jgi:hypothetical protein
VMLTSDGKAAHSLHHHEALCTVLLASRAAGF